jgi:hypothetical protein
MGTEAGGAAMSALVAGAGAPAASRAATSARWAAM